MSVKRFLILLVLAGGFISSSAFSQSYCFQGVHPNNVVATSLTPDSRCTTGYSYNTTSPSEYLVICGVSKVKANNMGWVTTRQTSVYGLPGCSTQGSGISHTIRRPQSGMWICESTAPSGFRILRSELRSDCGVQPGSTYFSYLIESSTSSSSSSNAGSSCVPKEISVGKLTAGSLASGDCKSGLRGSSYFTDAYRFTATSGQKVQIILSSSAFDTYVYLKKPNGVKIAENDDSTGTNSRIPVGSGYFTIPQASGYGQYVIEVTSYGSGSTGAYTVQVNK